MPTEPQNLSVNIAATIVFKWNAPKENGGEPIESYIVEYCDETDGKWLCAGSPTECMHEFDQLAQVSAN